jgi:hypothetical protein
MIGERSFETIVEAKTQIDALAKRKFIDGQQFADKVSFNMAKVVEKAIETERLPTNLGLEGLPAEERGRLFKLYLCGYYKGLPLLRVDRFYHDEKNHNVLVRSQNFELSQSQIVFTGSDKIAAMIYGDETIDPRIAKYKPASNERALGMATSFIRACSDPIAMEIDPWCKIIGGHTHAAEITKSGIRWLVPPVT